jgi:cytochrome c peroxidase
MSRRRILAAWVSVLAVALARALAADAPGFTEEEVRRILRHTPLSDPPPDETNRVADHRGAAALGERLFFEARLSTGRQRSCATCHDPARAFTDGKSLAFGTGRVRRHTPSLWNVAHNRWFFWDGRADSLWSQALKPIESPDEMGGSRLQSVRLLATDPALRSAYEAVFGELPALDDVRRFPQAGGPLHEDPAHPDRRAWEAMAEADRQQVSRAFANMGKAIAAFERQLVSRTAPFDVFAEGLRTQDPRKLVALGPSAQRGLKLFVGRANCRRCHSGPLFSDGEFHDIGVPTLPDAPYDVGRFQGIESLLGDEFRADGAHSDDRQGPRSAQVRFLKDRAHTEGFFKTPSLRNVALTAPYMHQGQLASLRAVLQYYSTLEGRRPPLVEAVHQEVGLAPLRLSAAEIDDLEAFLESLSDSRYPR